MPRMSGPMLKQLPFDLKAPYRMYNGIHMFEIEVKNIFLTSSYNVQDSTGVPIIMNWLGCERFRLIQTLNNNEKEMCGTSARLLKLLSKKFKPMHNETI